MAARAGGCTASTRTAQPRQYRPVPFVILTCSTWPCAAASRSRSIFLSSPSARRRQQGAPPCAVRRHGAPASPPLICLPTLRWGTPRGRSRRARRLHGARWPTRLPPAATMACLLVLTTSPFGLPAASLDSQMDCGSVSLCGVMTLETGKGPGTHRLAFRATTNSHTTWLDPAQVNITTRRRRSTASGPRRARTALPNASRPR